MTQIFECSNLSKSYGFGHTRISALCALNLSLFSHSVYRIFCPDKLSRLTLANLLSGMEHADSGEISFCGQDYSLLTDSALQDLRIHRIGLVHSKHGLISSTNVLQNVKLPALFLEDSQLSEALINETAAQLLSHFDLLDHASAFPSSLSSSDRLRVAICSELCKRPNALIIDGAFDDLTINEQNELSLQLQHIARSTGCTVAILTHGLYRVSGEIPISVTVPKEK